MAKELLAYRLNTIHNLHYYMGLMTEIRRAIQNGRFRDFCEDFIKDGSVKSPPSCHPREGGGPELI
jgi:tRNA-guanine family transglycosylase